MVLDGERWRPADPALAAHGLDEQHPIDDSSAGRADQAVLARARALGLPAIMLRASSVYGPRQTGHEEQTWVARFLLRAIEVTALLGWLLDQRTGRPQTLENLGPILADAMRA